MNTAVYHSNSLSDTQRIATDFAKQLHSGDMVVFNGDLGAGKTEFIRAICNEFGTSDDVASPTFTLINQYRCQYNDITSIYHIDLYRIEKKAELYELGLSELLEEDGAVYFIEWAENSFGMLEHYNYKITITPLSAETERSIEITIADEH
jgi:tRNA threonylcarbamoyladenosine biosynthesis protein TsaE